jgi:hypothetical protein
MQEHDYLKSNVYVACNLVVSKNYGPSVFEGLHHLLQVSEHGYNRTLTTACHKPSVVLGLAEQILPVFTFHTTARFALSPRCSLITKLYYLLQPHNFWVFF